MTAPAANAFGSVVSSYANLWRGTLQYAALMSRVGVAGLALWAPPRRRDEALAALARTMDLYMRGPAFLELAHCSLKMMSLGLPYSTMSLPGLLLRRRSF